MVENTRAIEPVPTPPEPVEAPRGLATPVGAPGQKVTWQAPWKIVGCYRCGSAVRVRQAVAHRQQFCSDYCRTQQRRATVQSVQQAEAAARRARIAATPLHEIYPGMTAVFETVQRRRPSYRAWRVAR